MGMHSVNDRRCGRATRWGALLALAGLFVLSGCDGGVSDQDLTAADAIVQPLPESQVYRFRLHRFHADLDDMRRRKVAIDDLPRHDGFLEASGDGLYRATLVYRRKGGEEYMRVDGIRFTALPGDGHDASARSGEKLVVTLDLNPSGGSPNRYHYGLVSHDAATGTWIAHGLPRFAERSPWFGHRDELLRHAARVFSDEGVQHAIEVSARPQDDPEYLAMLQAFAAAAAVRNHRVSPGVRTRPLARE